MGYVLNDQLEVSIFFGDTEFPLEAMNTLDCLLVECMIGTVLPTFLLKITDAMGLIEKQNLVFDGSQVAFVVKPPGSKESQSWVFRVFKCRNVTTQMGNQWWVDGYLDYPRYWLQTVNTGSYATSSGIMNDVAGICGLRAKVDNTSDAQLWHPQNKTWGEWVRSIAPQGYGGPEALMCQGTDLDGVLHYRNFNKEQKPIKELVYGSVEGIPVIDYSPSMNSGLTNRLTGYNNEMHSQSAVREGQTHSELTFRPDARQPMLSQNLKAEARRGYQQFGPIDFGNTNPEAERAVYQNRRYANLYNLTNVMLTTRWTGLTLFDTLNFVARSDDPTYGGLYKVSAKQIKIEATAYSEFICGEAHGTNNRNVR